MTEVCSRLMLNWIPYRYHSLKTLFDLQFWKSNAMFWCDYCKVWMNDNPATKATHEAGMKHKDNVARSKSLSICASRPTDQPVCLAPACSGQHTIAIALRAITSHDVLSTELRQMRQKQDQSKRDLVEAQRSMSSIEAAAQRQYQADLKAAEELQQQKLGEWVSACSILPGARCGCDIGVDLPCMPNYTYTAKVSHACSPHSVLAHSCVMLQHIVMSG